ncbi:MAG: TIR domain-containing protein [bacterium]
MITIAFLVIGLLVGFLDKGFSIGVLVYGFTAALLGMVLARIKGRMYGWPPLRSRCGTVFISYRREYAAEARRVAEALYSEGIGVWMDEYRIGLGSTANLEQRLLDGVRMSSSALIIADGGWEESKWCFQNEGMPILDMIPVDKIIVASTPPLRLSLNAPGLDNRMKENLEYIPLCPLNVVIAKMAEKAGSELTLQKSASKSPQMDRFSYHGFDFALNVAGWSHAVATREKSAFPHRYYERQLGTNTLSLGLCCGALPGRVRAEMTDYGAIPEGRRFYEGVKSSASFYMKSGMLDGWKLAGVHLFRFGGRGQLSFTFRKPSGWYRRYPLAIDYANGQYEFDFFFIWGGSFREFCKYAYIMDDMVGSFEYRYTKT